MQDELADAGDARVRTRRRRDAALMLSTPYAYAQVCVFIVIGLLAAAAVLGWQDPSLGDRMIVPGAIALGGSLLAVAITRILAPAALKREAAWVDKLPFKLDGYLDAFEQPMSRKAASGPGFATHTARAMLRIQFAGTPATSLPDIIRGLGKGTWIKATTDTITLTSVDSPRALHTYVHDLADRVLIPLHREHAIERVTVALDAA